MLKVKNFMPLLLAAVPFMLCGAAAGRMPTANVGVAKVTLQTDKAASRYTGQVVSKSVVNIVSRVSGEIRKVGFTDGSVVKAGQLLYEIDPVRYEAAQKAAEASVDDCKAKLRYAQSRFERDQQLFERKAVSKDAFESTRASYESAKAALKAAEAELTRAKEDLIDTRICSPMRGVAGINAFSAGNYITSASGTLVTIIQMQPVRVRFSMSMADIMTMFSSINDLKSNGLVTLKLANGLIYDKTGTVELIDNQANRTTDTVQVYALFANDDFKLLPGSTVTVTLEHKKGVSRPAVPPSAVLHDASGAYVYLVQNGVAVKRYVSLGAATADSQLITGGISAGETVVVKGTHKVYPGIRINPVEND